MTCATCRFFFQAERWKTHEPHTGECRRRAPTDTTNSGRGWFPLVATSEWCGEHEPRPIPDAAMQRAHEIINEATKEGTA